MNYINFKGIDSREIQGLLICELPPISKPQIRTSTTEIDGRDGDIVEENGYKAYDKKVSIALTYNYDINKIINFFNGNGNLILSNEPDKVYQASIYSQIDYERLLKFKTANITFHIQPFKYLLNENLIEEEITEQEEIKVTNKGLEIAKPIITLYGSGIVTLAINGLDAFKYEFEKDDDYVTVDSLKEEAYKDSTLKNRQMTGEFPKFQVGENSITWTGNVTKIIVEPKSRWL